MVIEVLILSHLTVNEFKVHDSFAEEVADFDANCIMERSEIESLFTNIPLDVTVENCINDRFSSDTANFSNVFPVSRFLHLITNIIVN